MAALLQTDEPENCGLDRVADSEKTVILEESRFAVSEGFGNLLTINLGKYNAVELVVQDMILCQFG